MKVRYLKPGGDAREWVHTLLADMEEMIISSFQFRLEKPFSPFDGVCLIKDGYFGLMFDLLDRWYNVVKIYDEGKELVGYYSDIRTLPERTEEGYEATDLFLDFWVKLDGTYMILDVDEFHDAGLDPRSREKAKKTACELREVIEGGDYPPDIVEEFDLPSTPFKGEC